MLRTRIEECLLQAIFWEFLILFEYIQTFTSFAINVSAFLRTTAVLSLGDYFYENSSKFVKISKCLESGTAKSYYWTRDKTKTSGAIPSQLASLPAPHTVRCTTSQIVIDKKGRSVPPCLPPFAILSLISTFKYLFPYKFERLV